MNEKSSINSRRQWLLGIVVVLLLIFNQWQISQMRVMMGMKSKPLLALGSLFGEQAQASVIPTGVPTMPYGAALGVNFDQVEASMNILESYDRGANTITLTGDKLERYVKIGQQTSCEYCCGAKTLVFDDGRPACGCAHSAAMRGLIAYLLTNNGDQLSDEQILTEANKWKAVFFPKQTMEKALRAQAETGQIDPNIINQMPAMVGGC